MPQSQSPPDRGAAGTVRTSSGVRWIVSRDWYPPLQEGVGVAIANYPHALSRRSLVVLPLTDVFLTIGPRVGALPVHLAVPVLTDVFLTIGPRQGAYTVIPRGNGPYTLRR